MNSNQVHFISDTHFGHANAIKFSHRPYFSADEMNAKLIANWNSVVKTGDFVCHLGDYAFGNAEMIKEITSQLNGQIFLVLGNHDSIIRKKKELQSLFVEVSEYKEIKVKDSDAPNGHQKVCLFHYACRVWNQSHRGSWQLYGHSHGSLPDDPHSLSMDVGVDATKLYRPISYAEVKQQMSIKVWKPVDYHGELKEG